MVGRSEDAPVEMDVEGLEHSLKALSFSNRLKLLEMLRVPRTVDEIHLTPSSDSEESGTADRPLSREAVRHHLERLAEAGLVQANLEQHPDGRTRKEYVLDESQLYVLAETLRGLCTRDEEPAEGGARMRRTQEGPAEPDEPWPDPPRLVLVHGAPQKRAFGLRGSDRDPPRGWVIGRGPDVAIRLPYDPYVSEQNSEVLPREEGFSVVNLRTALNGTILNDEPLDPGEDVALEHGDVLEVGASRLVFHAR